MKNRKFASKKYAEEFSRIVQKRFINHGKTEEDVKAYINSLLQVRKKGNIWTAKTKDGKIHRWDTSGSFTPSLAEIFG